MKKVRQIHYRYLTDADFFNLNKPSGTEEGGGGQSYIDFPASTVPVEKWERFFNGVERMSRTIATQGPKWRLPVYSLGNIPVEQPVEIYQRRPASVTISSQKLHTRHSNRIKAWLPSRGFPEPVNPAARRGQLPVGLCVYLVRTSENQVWAGWFIRETQFLADDHEAAGLIAKMVSPDNEVSSSGFIEIGENENLILSETKLFNPFSSAASATALPPGALADTPGRRPPQPARVTTVRAPSPRNDADPVESLFNEDTETDIPQRLKTRVQLVKIRNAKAVKDLKDLYRNRCQISGEQFAFKKINGEFYSEAHHLIALGDGGADDPKNMIVVSPLIHRMLHYARVTGLDLTKIVVNSACESRLEIEINGQAFYITWHKDHARRVLQHATRI